MSYLLQESTTSGIREHDTLGGSNQGDKMGWTYRLKREMKDSHIISVRKPEGERPLGKTTRRWEDNIKNRSYRAK
jgi:hypothetical protein